MRREFSIGQVRIVPNLILAPMSGVTSAAFRELLLQENPGAVGLSVTEFISIEGLTRGNQQSANMMRRAAGEKPFSIQIFGYDIDRMTESAQMAEASGAEIVDINCGCPVPKVVKRGGGCELMRQPDHLETMLAAVVKAVKVPVTLKIRSGWNERAINAVDVALRAEAVGIQAVTVHGRTREQLYRGEADWEIVEQVANAVKIPVIGSGDIVDAESARRRLRSSAIAGLMVGRAALSNPWVFREIQSGLDGDPIAPAPYVETARILKRYMEKLIVQCALDEKSDRAAMGRLKQLASQVTRRVPGSADTRRALCTMNNLEDFRRGVETWEENLASGRYRFEESEWAASSERDDSDLSANGEQGVLL